LSAADSMMTVLEVLTAANEYLTRSGVENPRLNAEHLLAHVLGKKRLDLYLQFDRPLGDRERSPLRELVRRRASGVPLQHLLGTVEFHGRTFLSDPRGLIARPETEQLVEWVLAENRECTGPLLDVGTGSGVIAITLALALPSCPVWATDISSDALALARENAEKHGTALHFSQADLLPAHPLQFAVIVANLPYIPTGQIPELSREVQHDPATALDGGPDGLRLIERLLADSPERLLPGGAMYLEVGHDQGERVRLMLESANFRDIRLRSDYQGVQRFLSAKHG